MTKGTLTVFDLDDTLFYCKAQIYVTRPDGSKFKIRSSLDHKLQEGETIDYSEFRSAQLFADTAVPIDNMVKRFKDIRKNNQNPKSVIIILTARADFDDRELFLETLNKHGVYHQDVHVHRSGNINVPELSTAQKKCAYVSLYLSFNQFNKVRLFDDSYANLRAFAAMRHDWPDIEFEIWHVDHTGECKLF